MPAATPRSLDNSFNTSPLTAALEWVDASTVADDSDPIAVVIGGETFGRPRAIVCTADGDITLRSASGVDLTLTLTADPRPLPYAPTGIDATGLTATVYLLY